MKKMIHSGGGCGLMNGAQCAKILLKLMKYEGVKSDIRNDCRSDRGRHCVNDHGRKDANATKSNKK